ncbi:MAG TPA: NAD(P)-dependent oxidoreductase [Candidatus Pseudogracilibacillus intestinigallinarum]|uniref:NAD(P)-dependent oxidoreductase n=1 Tax=Candidatus Pseudogracilibacillus intestinigallinarum TaxID=2838742 RepID=A0A9D1TK20_9BACI|nr:NAD(P)-dependent oxidoreductase [Candidatus Pseudogracilibacillus intestinigallinarum]
MTEKATIGFIGTGVMGESMARHLMNAGYPVHIFTRTKAKAHTLMEEGAIWEDSVTNIAKKSDIIITMIGTPKDVEDVYFNSAGLIAHAKQGTYLIDMTTSKPSLAKEIYEKAKEKDLHALDAPVSGGDVGAKNAKLAIMVGGEENVFNEMLPIFQIMGENIRLQGPAGSGQHTKAVNQISIAPAMVGLCEALMYAKNAGLDPKEVLASISTGAAGSWSMDNYAPRMIDGNFDPGFAIKHYIKDMKIALESAQEMNMQTPGLELALAMYKKLAEKGEGENGIHALLKYYEE